MAGIVNPIVPYTQNRASPAAGAVVELNQDVGPVKELIAFNIRNGDVNAARSLLVRPTIPECYHWCPIANMPVNRAISQMFAYIKVAFAQLNMNPPTGEHDRKKIAIAIGVARAVVTQLYQIADGDLIAGERADPILIATVGTDAAQTISYNAVRGASAAVTAALAVDLVLDNDDRAAIAALHMSSIGLPAVQGYSLVMVQHHYISTAGSQSRKAFDVIERAHWKDTSVKPWFDAALLDIQDALWHKACHPIVMNTKIKFAQSMQVVAMLKAAGAGTAASRLPALEPEIRCANSYKTLLETVQTMYAIMASVVDTVPLLEAMYAVEHFPLDAANVGPHGFATVPNNVIDRHTALRHLARVCSSNKAVVAHAYGFYCAMMAKSELITGTEGNDTLITSHSLKKLPKESPAAYLHGQAMHEDYVVKKKYHRDRGEFMSFNLIVKPVTADGTLAGEEPVVNVEEPAGAGQ